MTVASSTSRISSLGNGVTTVYPFPYAFFAATDLQVYVGGILKVLNTDYTLSGTAPYTSGSNVTFTSAPANGAAVVIVRVVPYTQTMDLVPNDPLPAETLEQRLDLNVMMCQQIVEQLGRSFVIPVTDVTGTTVTLPAAASRANQALIFDGSGNVTVGTPTGSVVSSAMQPVVSASSIDGAKSLMGITSGFLNMFRNPFMEVAQRGTSGTNTAGVGSYTLDGWAVLPTGANISWQQAGSVLSGSTYSTTSLGLLGASGLTGCTVYHRIESNMAGQISGRRVTVQFVISNQTGAPLTPTISTYYPTATDNHTSVVGDLGVTSLQTIASGATATVSYTFNTNFLASRGYGFDLNFGAQLNGAGKNVYISAADIRVTPDAPLGLNNSPPRPEYRPRGTEALLCQRYYESGNGWGYNYSPGSGNYRAVMYVFKVNKRTDPSITVSNVGYGGAGANTLVIEQVTSAMFGARVSTTSAGSFVCEFNFQASSEL
jgi:hypothetical protein